MSKSFDNDRGSAERAMLYNREEDENKDDSSSQSDTQIVKLLEQVKNRLEGIDNERSELWDAVKEQTKLLNEIDDRSTSTEKSFLSIENRLSRSELTEAPIIERLDKIERLQKKKNDGVGDELRRELLDKMEESDRQTNRLIERVDEAMAMQTRMTRRIDKVVQDKQRLNRKISLLEETIDVTRQALSAKAMVLLTDKGLVSKTNTPNIPLLHETKSNDDFFEDRPSFNQKSSSDDETFEQNARRTDDGDGSFSKQLMVASFFVIVAAGTGWLISQGINSQPQTYEVPASYERTVQPGSNYLSKPYNQTDITDTPAQDTNYSLAASNYAFDRNITSQTEIEIAQQLNNIQPTAGVQNLTSESPSSLNQTSTILPVKKPVEAATSAAIEQPSDNFVPAVFAADESLPDDMKQLEIDAFRGNAEAQHDLAVIYTAGHSNVPQNFERAAHWFHKASDKGIANARYNLGVLYHQGLGVDQNLAEAIKWYHKAAELGHAEAQYNLGIAYIEGIGVDYNPQQAASFFQSAAAGGVPEAAFNLGLIYENGLTGSVQPQEAILWYKTASDLGNPDARNAIEQLARNLNININDIDRYIEQIKTPSFAKQSQLSGISPAAGNSGQDITSKIQEQLISFGLYPGPADGAYGPLTADAIRLYQARHNIPVTGEPTESLLTHMMTKNLKNASFVELGSGE